MQYTSHYDSPLDEILLAADDAGLTGLWFVGQKYFALHLTEEHEDKEIPVLATAKRWLSMYFAGENPDFTVLLHLMGTAFQNEVWKMLCAIPYGQIVTYGEIARRIAIRRGLASMSAQAVGGAIGHNRLQSSCPAIA